ncbi:MAG: hypothetical protein NUV56_01225 [Candidatus Uhrbacteria bacterium]|nr:hypothetical protein [Candidatus Uhrbacteria bacterium]
MTRVQRKDGRFMFAHADIFFADRKGRNRLFRVRIRRQATAAKALAFFSGSR